MIDRLIDSYAKKMDVQTRVDAVAHDYELTKVSAAGHGFALSSAEDELDRIECGKVNTWDPMDPSLGPSWLYRDTILPPVDNKDHVRQASVIWPLTIGGARG